MGLSKESEEFIANLRMYLLTSGKNDKEIEEVAEELSSHLEEAESRGKSVQSVTGGSPEAYMKSIRAEMKTDIRGLAKWMPMFSLLVIAYLITGSAIRGDLSFSLVKLILFPLIIAFSTVAYLFFFRSMSVKNWSAKREMLLFMGIQAAVIVLLAAVLFWDIFLSEPFYTPTREAMWWIAGAGVIIFILSAIITKTWITVVLPLFLFGPDFVMQFTAVTLAQQLAISTSVLYGGLALILLIIWLRRKKQDLHTS